MISRLTAPVEQRRHARTRSELHAEWGRTGACPYPGLVTSLSAGGCFIRTAGGARRGQILFVRLWLSPEGPGLVRGRVAYNLKRAGLAVEFEGVAGEESEPVRASAETAGLPADCLEECREGLLKPAPKSEAF